MSDQDEIERLRAEVAALKAERDALKADANLLSLNAVIKTLQAEVAALKADVVAERGYRAAADEIAKRRGEMVDALTAERDEARREVLNSLKYLYTTTGLRLELARRGWWDWYKEVQP